MFYISDEELEQDDINKVWYYTLVEDGFLNISRN